MDGNKKLVPQRRFKEFQNANDWEQRKLVDEAELFSGLTYSPNNVVKENGTLVLRSSNVKNGEIVSADNVYVDPNIVNSCNVNDGDVIVVVRNGSRSLIGKHAQIKGDMDNTVIGAFMTGIRSVHPAFINALLNTQAFDREVEKNLGATINQITNGTFQQMKFMFPKSEEQNRIGETFTHLDNLITLHQRKLEKTKALKAAFLSEMFPAEGERVPKRRFTGFTGDWEQRKVNDLLELLTDFDANGSFESMAKNVNTFDGDGFAWYVRMTDLENKSILSNVKYVDKSSYDFLKKTHLHGGELLMAKRGDIGKVYVFNALTAHATLAPNMYLLKLNEKVIPNFLYNFFITDDGNGKLKKINASTTMGALYKDDVKNIDVIIPKLKEQEKISDFFLNIDNLITLHQRKLEKLQNIKKAYLNELFI